MATEVSGYLRDDQPYSCIGIIQVTFPDGYQARGTCTLVGINDILTATHMVYAPDHGGWADDYTFNFGADYNDTTGYFEDYGYEYSPSEWSTSAWPDQVFNDSNNELLTLSESEYDIAIIGVNAPIGDELGWLGIDPGYYGDFSANAVGYPVGATGMMRETVYASENPNYYLFESYYDSMGPGSSGGPLLIGNYVIGVKSTGYHWADVGYLFDTLVDKMEENNSLLPFSYLYPDFDPLEYLACNNDLIVVFGTDVDAATDHYGNSGHNEGRATDFDEWGYLASNEDLMAAFGSDADAATRHFVTSGHNEGRPTDFDEWGYLASNEDLMTAFGTDADAATRHYVSNGHNEGRTTDFDALSYLAANSDLQSAFGSDTEAATMHYVNYGYEEGRAIQLAGVPDVAVDTTVIS